jgi:hypothetical protein
MNSIATIYGLPWNLLSEEERRQIIRAHGVGAYNKYKFNRLLKVINATIGA